MTLGKNPAEVDDYVLYHIICRIDDNALPKGYPPQEILAELQEKRYSDEKVKLPLTYKVIQIDDDQWIGRISVKEIFKLGNSNLINYNENAQRVMVPIRLQDGEVYEININERAVDSIQDSFIHYRYIPNVITLNMPNNDTTLYHYEEKLNELTIKKIKAFDILDGYHRYLAISRICSLDPEFDYNMELRITYFSDEKARQFIWQEDQKTKMTKIDSESLNKYNPANIIVKKIQDSSYGNIISHNKGIISSPILSQAISVAYKINSSKNYKISEINAISKEIVDGFDLICESNPKIFDERMDSIKIYCLICMIRNQVYDSKKLDKLSKEVVKQGFLKNVYTHGAYKRIESILKGGK